MNLALVRSGIIAFLVYFSLTIIVVDLFGFKQNLKSYAFSVFCSLSFAIAKFLFSFMYQILKD